MVSHGYTARELRALQRRTRCVDESSRGWQAAALVLFGVFVGLAASGVLG